MKIQNNFKTAVNELMNGNAPMEDTEDNDTEETSNRVVFNQEPIREKSGEVSILGEDFIIEGSIMGASTIQINGRVKGNVTSSKDIIIRGTIEGDVKGESITMNLSNVKGNITAERHVTINKGSVVIGNISAGSVELNGKVKGDIQAIETTVLQKEAIVFGNISGKSISMESGSMLKGQLEILSMPINENEFKFESVKSITKEAIHREVIYKQEAQPEDQTVE